MLRKVAIGFGIVLLVLLVTAVGTGAYLWRQATAMPEWADEAMAEVEADTDGAPVDPGWVEMDGDDGEDWDSVAPPAVQPEPALSQGGPPRPAQGPAPETRKKKTGKKGTGSRQMRNFHLRTASQDKALRKATRASRAVYQDGTLEAGFVLDMSRLSREDLKEKNRPMYDRALKVFPPLRGTKVYIAIVDQPVSDGGYLQLGHGTRVKIGNLDYSLPSAARRLGLSPKKVKKEINRELRRLKVTDPDAPPPPAPTPKVEGPI